MYVIMAILAFSVLIIVHELGHFTLAKLNGVKVDEFSLGMGPKIFGIKGKETEYMLKAFPIGGYVKMHGEEEKSSDPRAFSNKSPERKLSIIAAGPIMNLLLAIVSFMLLTFAFGFVVPTISEVSPDSPAKVAGIQKGDKIIRINNTKVSAWEDLTAEISVTKGQPLSLTIERNGTPLSIVVTPAKMESENRFIIGISPTKISNPSIGESFIHALNQTKFWAKQPLSILKGKVSMNDVGGPITIIKVSTEAAKVGIWTLINFMAILSVQLAIFNIIPFPALDGGWIFMLLFEIITRKKIDDKKVAIVNYIGFTFLMAIMVLVLLKDIFFPIKF